MNCIYSLQEELIQKLSSAKFFSVLNFKIVINYLPKKAMEYYYDAYNFIDQAEKDLEVITIIKNVTNLKVLCKFLG